MIEFIKKLLGLDLFEESRKLRGIAEKNLEETRRLLTIDGEEKWMLNLCKEKDGQKECLPNEK